MRKRRGTSMPARSQLAHLLEQRLRRQHHAVADEAGHVVVQDAGGNQPQDGLLAVDDQRVAGVVAALEAHHAGDAVGQQIDDLALAFVAPLGADDDHVAIHRPTLIDALTLRTRYSNTHAGDHAGQPPQPQLPVGESRQRRQHALHRLRD